MPEFSASHRDAHSHGHLHHDACGDSNAPAVPEESRVS